jgi:hypothetical protein
MTPLAIPVEFMPDARHMVDPLPLLQIIDFPEVVRADAAVTLNEVTSPVAYGIVHCRAAGAVEAVRERFSVTDPP